MIGLIPVKQATVEYYRDEDFLSKAGKIQWIVSEDIAWFSFPGAKIPIHCRPFPRNTCHKHSHKKPKDSLDGSLVRLLPAVELDFRKIPGYFRIHQM